MYITINGIIAEKTIDLSYPIHSGKEAQITVITMFSDNIQYKVEKLLHSLILFLQVIGD